MVALAIASVLLLALAAMFINTSAARGEMDKASRQIETGRYAMQILADEIAACRLLRRAGKSRRRCPSP